jgi:hypothetical protein
VKSFQRQTYYELLEVSVGATEGDVRSAFERLSRLYADDQVALYGLIDDGRAQALRARLKEAAEVLLDDERRATYDTTIGLPPRDVPSKPNPVAPRPSAPAAPAPAWSGPYTFVTSAPPGALSSSFIVAAVPAPAAEQPARGSITPATVLAPRPSTPQRRPLESRGGATAGGEEGRAARPAPGPEASPSTGLHTSSMHPARAVSAEVAVSGLAAAGLTAAKVEPAAHPASPVMVKAPVTAAPVAVDPLAPVSAAVDSEPAAIEPPAAEVSAVSPAPLVAAPVLVEPPAVAMMSPVSNAVEPAVPAPTAVFPAPLDGAPAAGALLVPEGTAVSPVSSGTVQAPVVAVEPPVSAPGSVLPASVAAAPVAGASLVPEGSAVSPRSSGAAPASAVPVEPPVSAAPVSVGREAAAVAAQPVVASALPGRASAAQLPVGAGAQASPGTSAPSSPVGLEAVLTSEAKEERQPAASSPWSTDVLTTGSAAKAPPDGQRALAAPPSHEETSPSAASVPARQPSDTSGAVEGEASRGAPPHVEGQRSAGEGRGVDVPAGERLEGEMGARPGVDGVREPVAGHGSARPMDAPVADDSALVPTRAFTPREYRVPERPRPYEVPAGLEFNGDLLRQVRLARGLSLLQLSERTRIGVRHLENIESDRYDALPVLVYLRGMLMNLARELGLDGLRVSKSYLTFVEAHQAKVKG